MFISHVTGMIISYRCRNNPFLAIFISFIYSNKLLKFVNNNIFINVTNCLVSNISAAFSECPRGELIQVKIFPFKLIDLDHFNIEERINFKNVKKIVEF